MFYTSLLYLTHKDTDMQVVGGKVSRKVSMCTCLGLTLLSADLF